MVKAVAARAALKTLETSAIPITDTVRMSWRGEEHLLARITVSDKVQCLERKKECQQPEQTRNEDPWAAPSL